MKEKTGNYGLTIPSLLCAFPFCPDGEIPVFIFLRNNEKTKCFTRFFGVPAVVNIVGIDHPVQIGSAFFRPPFDSLMNNKIMKNQIENPI